MDFIRSSRGKDRLVHDGYIYVKQKDLANGVVSFECEERRNKAVCKAKLKVHIERNEVVGRLHNHTHAPSKAKIEAARTIQRVNMRAIDTEETPQQILSEACGTIDEETGANLPPIRHLRRNIRRHRQRLSRSRPLPLNTQELVLTDEHTKTKDGQDFLLFDSGPVEKRILIFGTQKNLENLCQASHWSLDGTFKTVPRIFLQLYTIHALVNDRSVPLIYALLPDKSQTTYSNLLEQLKSLKHDLAPKTIMIDFEKAMINSLQLAFPQTEIKGCYFHFCQSIYRKIQSNGFNQRYLEDKEFSIAMKMIAALALVPACDVEKSFESLCAFLPPETYPLQDYFEDTYLGRPCRRGRRREPLFGIELWNMYNRTADELPRTNNAVEGWHRSFLANVGCCHPNIWKFLTYIKREQALQQIHMVQSSAGFSIQSSRKKYLDVSARIISVTRNYENRDVVEYLRSIAYNLSF